MYTDIPAYSVYHITAVVACCVTPKFPTKIKTTI